MIERCGFDFNDLNHKVNMEEKELEELEKQKKREQQIKKEHDLVWFYSSKKKSK